MQLVSILIPTYNAEKWIRSPIDSVLTQTCPKKEIIVVDDGSKDATFEIASSFESPIVRVMKQDNLADSAARNHALAALFNFFLFSVTLFLEIERSQKRGQHCSSCR